LKKAALVSQMSAGRLFLSEKSEVDHVSRYRWPEYEKN
jgi:hypothetical protein